MYNYIFYRLYKISQKTEKQWPLGMRMPATIAMVLITILQFLNIMTIYVYIVYGLELIKPYSLSKELVIFIGLILYGVNYYFLGGKKLLKIEEKFDKKSTNLKLVGIILFWIYIVSSFVLFFLVLESFKTVNR